MPDRPFQISGFQNPSVDVSELHTVLIDPRILRLKHCERSVGWEGHCREPTNPCSEEKRLIPFWFNPRSPSVHN